MSTTINRGRDRDRRPPSLASQTLSNERIKMPTVRLIVQDGTNIGVVNTRDALQ